MKTRKPPGPTPRGEDDWKLISALLGERENLRAEAKRKEQGRLL
ncbi:MAG TPA: hypothetical protein VJL59_14525 [Anaerolineales bacterium]|nr:hypothetical protein [Anaerolineales bacterium]